MNKHQQHLLSCLKNAPSAEEYAALEALNSREWAGVLESARVLGLAPLLPHQLETMPFQIDRSILVETRISLQNNTARNLRILNEFGKIADLFREKNINLIPLKGLYLCTAVYKNIGERLMGDLDLLVYPSQLGDAVEALENIGYKPVRPYDIELEKNTSQHLPVYIKPKATPIEIHWTILQPRYKFALDFNALWDRSTLITINGAQAQALAPDDLLIYLCGHTAYHHMYIDGMRPLMDIKLVLEHFAGQFNWKAIRERSELWGVSNSVYLTLRLVQDLLNCQIPEQAWHVLLSTGFHPNLLSSAKTRIFERPDISPQLTSVWAKQSLLKRIKGLWRRIALPVPVLAGKYGISPSSRIVYFYYLVRIKDLLFTHGANIIDLLRGNNQQAQLAQQESELVTYLQWWDDKPAP